MEVISVGNSSDKACCVSSEIPQGKSNIFLFLHILCLVHFVILVEKKNVPSQASFCIEHMISRSGGPVQVVIISPKREAGEHF